MEREKPEPPPRTSGSFHPVRSLAHSKYGFRGLNLNAGDGHPLAKQIENASREPCVESEGIAKQPVKRYPHRQDVVHGHKNTEDREKSGPPEETNATLRPVWMRDTRKKSFAAYLSPPTPTRPVHSVCPTETKEKTDPSKANLSSKTHSERRPDDAARVLAGYAWTKKPARRDAWGGSPLAVSSIKTDIRRALRRGGAFGQ